MGKIITIMTVLAVLGFGLAMGSPSNDLTSSVMKFTGGPGFPAVDITTQPMTFTGG